MEIHFQTAKQHISIILWYTSTGKLSIPRLGTNKCTLSTRHCSMVTNSARVRDVTSLPVCTGRLVVKLTELPHSSTHNVQPTFT